ncbi:alpha-(1,3)-fucosyltransferase C, partial [Caerostris extrusa]
MEPLMPVHHYSFYSTRKPPPNTPADVLEKMNGKIHLMATYRKDSEVYSPYGWIEKRTTRFKIPDFKSDKNNVCWLVSHCQTSSKREVYVNILKQYIDVEIYGSGDKECPYGQTVDCYHWLAKRCKILPFFLKIQFVGDYVTEKLQLCPDVRHGAHRHGRGRLR